MDLTRYKTSYIIRMSLIQDNFPSLTKT
ncbi:hypothetical protein PSSM7_224 [Prochlorococcus phage P-SSM7]|uniref:Uncharacterized protein n=1 Tax=Prochlorococcus phage P-SSM7 TaxID=445688 RepID=E3SNY8_9CAUD|nr:hypothetical protein PSSM7_224 [Prochlorococcus phage P-SSM7]ADO98883.1 hypothetical protein PSSM7_224 [Prochlorococcus phage P-SSM7]